MSGNWRRPAPRRAASAKKNGGTTKTAPIESAPIEITIERLGAGGDGIAQSVGGALYVPGALPGERVLAAPTNARRGEGLAARLVQVLEPAATRIAAECRHFGTCGGCAIQHLAADAADSWKREILVSALRRAGADPALVAPLVRIPPGRRRRARLTFLRKRDGVILGFAERSSHLLVDLAECPALAPALAGLLTPLRALLASVVPAAGTGHVAVTLTDTGIDMVIEADAAPGLAARETLARFAEAQDLAQLSLRLPDNTPEPIARRRTPLVRFGRVEVEPPSGGFLQPSRDGERLLAALVTAAVATAPAGPVADLYAGCGAFTFPLAETRAVLAVEGDRDALAALEAAANRHGIVVATQRRDLARDPLAGKELSRLAALVFDPPRAGAAAQATALALSGPGLVVAVSCEPATLARDARILIGGGYELVAATPIDQFPWSAELEAVAVFRR